MSVRSDNVEPYRGNIFLRVLDASRKAMLLTLQMAGFSVAGLQVRWGSVGAGCLRWTEG